MRCCTTCCGGPSGGRHDTHLHTLPGVGGAARGVAALALASTMGLSILVPIAYIATLFLSLALFSRVYRGRMVQRLTAHGQDTTERVERTAKPVYEALAAIQEEMPPPGSPPSEWLVPRSTLQAALLVRAVDAVRRMMLVQRDKQAVGMLLERGQIGDDAATMLEATEKEAQAELIDVSQSAAAFHEGWGNLIFETANEVMANWVFRDVLSGIPKQCEEEGGY